MAGRLLHGDALMHDDLSDRDLDAHVGQNQNSANRKCELGIENDNAKDIVDARSVSNKTTPKRFSARIQEKTKNEKARLADQGVELSENTGQGSSRKKRKACRKMKSDLESSNKDDDQKKISKVISSTLESNAAADCVAALGAEPINPNADEVPQSGMASDRVSGDVTEKSDNARVKETLRSFNKYYLHFVQAEEQRCKKVTGERKKSKGSIEKAEQRCKKVAGERKKIEGSKDKKGGADKEDSKQSAKRPDLKAISKMLETNAVLYPEKRFGHIPGVAVGHQFFSRAEMVVVGLHGHWLKGIDYMGQSYCKGEYRGYTFPLAVAIVLSGQYEDDLDNWDEVVYTGQGGNNLLGNKRQVSDQVLERGNLALKNSFEQCVPVRVVRGHKSASSYVGKVYTYDGLYKVVHYWAEKGVSGYTVYKFRLKRLEGQPLLTTNQVHFSHGRIPKSISEIRGLVCEDITGGQEDIPIPATNLVEEPPVAPSGYTYCKSLQVSKNVKVPSNATGCSCKGSCVDPRACLCAKLNGSDFPYVHRDGGRLIEAKAVVFECGPRCGCGPGCVNRASQKGLKYRLEVFRTPRKGWAVRSWDYIPSGAPVCEYTGILMRTDELDNVSENNYIFEIDCLQTMKGLGGRESRSGDVSIPTSKILEKSDDQKAESPEFCIDAGPKGNIARFINHSCEPNLFVQCVLNSHHDVKLARVMLFAADSIPPMQELTYDYGYALDSVHGPDGKIMQMPCFCGATGCRKRLF